MLLPIITEAPRINTAYTRAGMKKIGEMIAPKRIDNEATTTVNGGARYL